MSRKSKILAVVLLSIPPESDIIFCRLPLCQNLNQDEATCVNRRTMSWEKKKKSTHNRHHLLQCCCCHIDSAGRSSEVGCRKVAAHKSFAAGCHSLTAGHNPRFGVARNWKFGNWCHNCRFHTKNPSINNTVLASFKAHPCFYPIRILQVPSSRPIPQL